jgi:hypothetical protein
MVAGAQEGDQGRTTSVLLEMPRAPSYRLGMTHRGHVKKLFQRMVKHELQVRFPVEFDVNPMPALKAIAERMRAADQKNAAQKQVTP